MFENEDVTYDPATAQIPDGATVYDGTGEKIGTVAEQHPGYLVVKKGWLFHKDFYVPRNEVTYVDEESISLRIVKDDLHSERYNSPPDAVDTHGVTGSDYTAGATNPTMASPTDRSPMKNGLRTPLRDMDTVTGKRAEKDGWTSTDEEIEQQQLTRTDRN